MTNLIKGCFILSLVTLHWACKKEQIEKSLQSENIQCVDSVSIHLVPIGVVGESEIVQVGGWFTNEGNCYLQAIDVEYRLYDESKCLINKWEEKVETFFEPQDRSPIDLFVNEHKPKSIEADIIGYYW